MSNVVTWVRRKSRLATLIDAAGGVSVGSALRAADANLAPMRERALEVINAHIERLATLAVQDGPTDERLDMVYRTTASILDAASPFGLKDVSAAAHNLCEIADDHAPGAPFDWRVVEVHVKTFQLLRALDEGDSAAREAVLGGLQQVAAHKIKARAER